MKRIQMSLILIGWYVAIDKLCNVWHTDKLMYQYGDIGKDSNSMV